jgi:toxin ParE1/3/4
MPVRISATAARDLEVAFAYVSERNRAAAIALTKAIRKAIVNLGDFPEMGAPLSPDEFGFIEPGVRFIVVEPYLVFYRPAADAVIVLRVLHARQDFLGELLGPAAP